MTEVTEIEVAVEVRHVLRRLGGLPITQIAVVVKDLKKDDGDVRQGAGLGPVETSASTSDPCSTVPELRGRPTPLH